MTWWTTSRNSTDMLLKVRAETLWTKNAYIGKIYGEMHFIFFVIIYGEICSGPFWDAFGTFFFFWSVAL